MEVTDSTFGCLGDPGTTEAGWRMLFEGGFKAWVERERIVRGAPASSLVEARVLDRRLRYLRWIGGAGTRFPFSQTRATQPPRVRRNTAGSISS